MSNLEYLTYLVIILVCLILFSISYKKQYTINVDNFNKAFSSINI